MRLIDADALIEKLYALMDDVYMIHADVYIKGIEDAYDTVRKMQTIDPSALTKR